MATPTKQRQLKFWTAFVARLAERTSAIKPQKPRPQHWIQIRAGFILSGTASQRDARLGVEFYINGKEAKPRFEQLRQQREPIEAKLGCALDWQELPVPTPAASRSTGPTARWKMKPAGPNTSPG